ncbi:GGDEF/EAL-containing response regulator [Halodesulfovibrio marinisediminis]|uniref:Diguanylate cyclase (GGDEF) domain-containing protein n=1 Tax=Halodesulfovibrio marinisediminis DSM 17456 TaxID=1121457 RepID=A0A1N6F5G1_9BACT|nr:EAL domain-containing protein [Halodesulfovibrio marinisediminis]SIN90490.1 diguanylate cyclase (GGDEF) domain-containing protein [Halodesulfovibrio marinisediminis DSM 17456]
MQGDTLHLLIIDDDTMLRRNISVYFEDSGFFVTQACNGTEGIELFSQNQPDIVIVDLLMPNTGGLAVVEHVKKVAPFVPVIVISGVNLVDEAVRALKNGAWEFISKPIVDHGVLDHAVKKCLERASLLLERRQYHSLLESRLETHSHELQSTNDQLVRYQQLLRSNSSFVNNLVEAIPSPLYISDRNFVCIDCNKAFCDMLQLEKSEVVARRIPDLLSTTTTCADALCSNLFENNNSGDCEITYIGKDNSASHYVLYRSEFMNGNEGKLCTLGVLYNITELKAQKEIVAHQAYHDELTSLPNRFYIMNFLHELLEQDSGETKFCLLFIDLDNFKRINDSLGHDLGDQLLKLVATRLEEVIGGNGKVARVGGDEFLVLLPNVTEEHIISRHAEQLNRVFKEPFYIASHKLHLSVTIGITCYPDDGHDANTLLTRSDIAMYRAKEQKRSSWMRFDSRMLEQVKERLKLERLIRDGLERHEFIPYFQPRFDVQTGEIVGAEALVRWIREDGSVGNPAEFIPVAEETGLVRDLGEQVLIDSCKQMHAWHEMGYSYLTISVNISAVQFTEDLYTTVRSVIEESGINPEKLELEITETIMMKNLDKTAQILRELAQLGVKIVIDDFGTGYSSLYYLKIFPIDILKIDRTFIDGIPEDENDGNIVSAILSMAKQMKLHVVAEGVETDEQLVFLQHHQCEEAQGFLFSKPVAADDFIVMLGDEMVV